MIESCSILTTNANSLLADIHDRMPVILRQENYDSWLDPSFKDVKALAKVLVPFDAGKMRRFPVSTRINSVTNDDPECVVPSHNSSPAQSAPFRVGSQIACSPYRRCAQRSSRTRQPSGQVHPRRPAGLPLTSLLHHLDEHFSGL